MKIYRDEYMRFVYPEVCHFDWQWRRTGQTIEAWDTTGLIHYRR